MFNYTVLGSNLSTASDTGSKHRGTFELGTRDLRVYYSSGENRWEDMARDVFRNRQRTSSTSGILKSEAVYRVCKILQNHDAETLATFRHALESGRRDELRRAITAVRGQGRGLSFDYLLILSGDTNAVKG